MLSPLGGAISWTAIFLKIIIKTLEVVEKSLRNKREREKKATQEISNSRRRTQMIKKK